MQKLWCTSFLEFKKNAYKNKWDIEVPDSIAIISINNSEYNSVPGEYHICRDSNNVLNLNFDDSDPMAYDLDDDASIYTDHFNTIKFFDNNMAEKAVRFIEFNKNKDFFIHCSAGISRSQAFVKYIINTYIDKEFHTNPNNPCEFANGFVYHKLNEMYRNINY